MTRLATGQTCANGAERTLRAAAKRRSWGALFPPICRERAGTFSGAMLGVLLTGACDSGVPPRNQADTLGGGSLVTASSSANVNESLGAPELTPARAVPSASKLDHTASPSPSRSPTGAPSAASSRGVAFDPDRACRTSADCALAPDDCTQCPPCEATWRRAVNRATLDRIVAAQHGIECPPISCVQCSPLPTAPGQPPSATGYQGDTAECQAGQCVTR